MLHLIFQSPLDVAVIERIDSQDTVVMLQNAVFQLHKNHFMAIHLQQLLKINVQVYVLDSDLACRGMTAAEVLAGLELIDYEQLVKLTIANKVTRTWN